MARGANSVKIEYRMAKMQDALFFYFIFRKRALQLVALLQKEACNLRLPMHLRHPIAQ